MPNSKTIAPDFSLNVLGRKIVFSTLVQYAGKIAQLVLAAFSIKMISNFLSQNGFGAYSAISEYALFFSTAANLGIFGNVVRIMADRPRDGSVFLSALALRVGTALVFFVTAVVLALLNGSGTGFVIGTALFCGSLFFDNVTSVCDGMLQANYLMGRASFALFAGKLVNAGVIFLVVNLFGRSSFGGALSPVAGAKIDSLGMFLIFGAVLAASFLTAGLSLYFVSRKIEWSWAVNRQMIVKIFVVSLPFGIINIVNNLYFRFLPDYLSHQFLDDKHFASFSISFRVAQVLSLASTFLMFSALPGLTEYIEQGHLDKARKLYSNIKKILFAGGMALVVFGSLLGPWVIALLTHEKYNLPEFWFVLPMMMLLAAISYGYDLVLVSLFAAGDDVWFMKREFLALGIAGAFFGLSYFIGSDMTTKMALILAGAIVGELFMVVSGMWKFEKRCIAKD